MAPQLHLCSRGDDAFLPVTGSAPPPLRLPYKLFAVNLVES